MIRVVVSSISTEGAEVTLEASDRVAMDYIPKTQSFVAIDITSQHLNQATQIVQAVKLRMHKLFLGLQEIGENNEAVRKLMESYSQEMANEDAQVIEDTIHNSAGAISQDEIDALFGD